MTGAYTIRYPTSIMVPILNLAGEKKQNIIHTKTITWSRLLTQIQQIKIISSRREFPSKSSGKGTNACSQNQQSDDCITGSWRKSPLCLSGLFQINSLCGEWRRSLRRCRWGGSEKKEKSFASHFEVKRGQSVAAPWHCSILSE